MEFPHTHKGKKHLPLPSGRFVVGCTDLMIGPSVHEGCFLRLYYPSQLDCAYANSSSWASWIPHSKYVEGYTIVLGMIPFLGKRLISWAFGNSYIPTVIDAPPAQDKFPVVVFSHGLTGCRTAYSVFCSELASHGFIVAAIEHRDGTACMSYHLIREQDKDHWVEDWIPYKPMKFKDEDMPIRKEQLLHRIGECQRTLDLLSQLNDGENIQHVLQSTTDLTKFKGLLDLTTPAIAGHSFGSATVLRTLAVEKRFKVGIALDAWMWPLRDETELAQQVEQPILFINMEAFQTPPNLASMKLFLTDHIERRVVTIKGSVHKNQVDLPFLLPLYLRRLAGAHSTIDPRLAMELNNRITLLYLRKHLGLKIDEEDSKYVDEHVDWVYEGIP